MRVILLSVILLNLVYARWTDAQMDAYENSCVQSLNHLDLINEEKHLLCGCIGDYLEENFLTIEEAKNYSITNKNSYLTMVQNRALQCANEIDEQIESMRATGGN